MKNINKDNTQEKMLFLLLLVSYGYLPVVYYYMWEFFVCFFNSTLEISGHI